MISTSATLQTGKYYWMRYSAERATVVTAKDDKLRIVKGTLFGVREIKGKPVDEVMLVTGQVFRLSIDKSEMLMNRSKEFKGVVKLKPVSTPTPAPKAKASVKKITDVRNVSQTAKDPNESKYMRALTKAGGHSIANIRSALDLMKDDAERIDFKRWVLTKIPRGTAKHGNVLKLSPKRVQNGPKVIVSLPKPKTRVTKLTAHPSAGKGPASVRLSEVELPDEDDFTDTNLPNEFKQYIRVSHNSASKE